MSQVAEHRSRWLVVLLSLVPVWLIASAGVAVWWSLRDDDKDQEERNRRYAMEMSIERIADDLQKFEKVIGVRNQTNSETLKALTRAAAMIDGTLGPSNTGYQIQRIPGPEDFPIIRVTLGNAKDDLPSFWVLTAYDSEVGNAVIPHMGTSATTGLVAAAQAMSRDDLECVIHFIFVPYGFDVGSFIPSEEPDGLSLLAATVKNIKAVIEPPTRVFCIENLGASSELVALTADPDSPHLAGFGNLGRIEVMQKDRLSLTVGCIQAGLPAIGISSTHQAATTPNSTSSNIAICAGKLVEWLRRAARLEAAK